MTGQRHYFVVLSSSQTDTDEVSLSLWYVPQAQPGASPIFSWWATGMQGNGVAMER